MSRLVSFIILAAIVLLMAGMFFWVMAQFVLPIFIALVLVVMLRPLHQWLTAVCGGRVRLAALLTTLATLLTVLVPAALLVTRAASEGMSVAGALNRQDLVDRLGQVRAKLNLGLPSRAVRLRCDAINGRVAALRDAPPWPAEVNGDDEISVEIPPGEVQPRQAPAELEAADGPPAAAQPLGDAKTAEPPPSRAELTAELEHQLSTLGQELDREYRRRRPARDPRWEARLSQEHAQVARSLAALAEAVGQLPTRPAALLPAATTTEGPPEQETAAGQTPDLAWTQAVDRVASAHQAFRETLLGDPFWYWVKLQANPEDDQARLDDLRQSIQSLAGPLALSTTQAVAGFVGKFVVGLCILLVSLYYFLADGAAMVDNIMRLSPLDRRFGEQMLAEFDKVSRAVVLATLLSALVQGLLAGIGFFVAGIGAVFLLSLLTMVLAMVPFVGAAAVWGGCALWLLLYEERTWAACLLALYGAGIVSTSDNVIKPLVLHGQSNIHPLLALLSVLGGVTTLGPIGIFVGPMVVAFLHALLIMLQAELSALSGEPQPPLPPPKRRFRLR